MESKLRHPINDTNLMGSKHLQSISIYRESACVRGLGRSNEMSNVVLLPSGARIERGKIGPFKDFQAKRFGTTLQH